MCPVPAGAVGQHFRCDEDRSIGQDREVQRIAGPGSHQPCALRALNFDGGRISAFHDPVQPDFPHPATEAAHQRCGELVGHGTTPLQALEAGVEGEGLGMADTDHQVAIPVQLVQHDVLGNVGAVFSPTALLTRIGTRPVSVAAIMAFSSGQPGASSSILTAGAGITNRGTPRSGKRVNVAHAGCER